MIATTNLGFPRMGAGRELKWALERAWRGEDPGFGALIATGEELRARHWRQQAGHGLAWVPCGDFSFYDHVADTAVAVGAVPARFGFTAAEAAADGAGGLACAFALARGTNGVAALELTKWFDTNYHYLVPELDPDQEFRPGSAAAVARLREATALGVPARPVLLGPVSFLHLARRTDGGDPLALLDGLLEAYGAIVADLVAAGAPALELDEPVLATDLAPAAAAALRRSVAALKEAAAGRELTVASYYGPLLDNAGLALGLGADVLHVDLVRGPGQIATLAARAPAELSLSLGAVDGRNVWRTDLGAVLGELAPVAERLGEGRLRLAPSCPLLHLPVSLAGEDALDPELRSWLAFADERLRELAVLAGALDGRPDDLAAVAASTAAARLRRASPRLADPAVRAAVAALGPVPASPASGGRRARPPADLGLPPLPTTTIGSFPQDAAVRRLRAARRAGAVDAAAYDAALAERVRDCVRRQEDLGLDVLVHGEFERTDMVEYFATQLRGFAVTAAGWVQSYGSRCVKPPVLYGDVARPEPMTVRWAEVAAASTDRPVKGMLTGPVTMLAWSFVRDDQPRADTARQVALALRGEVADLEAAGLRIVQIDEPALREALPLRVADRPAYLAWAVEAFRIAAGGASGAVQVHTHMCYVDVGEILDAVAALGADVVSIEAARSGMALLAEVAAGWHQAGGHLGPGVWDVHSPRVPSDGELDERLARAVAAVGAERLWVNPDCGLKTRDWPEVEASLRAMVAAARRARAALR